MTRLHPVKLDFVKQIDSVVNNIRGLLKEIQPYMPNQFNNQNRGMTTMESIPVNQTKPKEIPMPLPKVENKINKGGDNMDLATVKKWCEQVSTAGFGDIPIGIALANIPFTPNQLKDLLDKPMEALIRLNQYKEVLDAGIAELKAKAESKGNENEAKS